MYTLETKSECSSKVAPCMNHYVKHKNGKGVNSQTIQRLTHVGNYAFTHQERTYAVEGANEQAENIYLWVRNDGNGRDAGDELNYLNQNDSFFFRTGNQRRITALGQVSNHQNATLYDQYGPRANFLATVPIPASPANFFGFPVRPQFNTYTPMAGPEDCVQYARGVIGRDQWWGHRHYDDFDALRIAAVIGVGLIPAIRQPTVNLQGGGVANFDYSQLQQTNNADPERAAVHRDMIFTVGNQIRNWLIGVGPFNFHGEAVIATASGSNKVVSKACVGQNNIFPRFTLYGVRDEFDPLGINNKIRSFSAKYNEDPNFPNNNNISGTVHH